MQIRKLAKNCKQVQKLKIGIKMKKKCAQMETGVKVKSSENGKIGAKKGGNVRKRKQV